MPKSSSISPKPPPDLNLVRKKKNADAQAAFRARRQNYISTLEETVTSLESVVIQLQESCRETRNENLELRQENSRLRYENREREKYWKAFVQARKSGPRPVSSPFPPPPTPHLHPPVSYSNSLSYRASDPSVTHAIGSSSFVNHTSAIAFTTRNDDGSSVPQADRSGKYATYPYSILDSPRDPRWQLPTALPTSSCLSSTGAVTPQSMKSPSLTASADLAPAYPGLATNDRKVVLDAVLSGAPYVFPGGTRYQNLPERIPHSRSMSPTTSASSATSLPLTTSYQLPFQDPSTSGHPGFGYRGQSLSRCPEVTLHGDIPAGQHLDSVLTKTDSNADYQDHLPMGQQNDGVSQHEDSPTRLRGNRNIITHPYRTSQSPGPTPLSSTVAVIKAQAFGALRRTRAKTKRTSDSALRVAQDVLEARGIGPGPAKMYEGDFMGKP